MSQIRVQGGRISIGNATHEFDCEVDDFAIVDGTVVVPETAADLCQYRRPTEHVLDREYWDAILDFADLHLRT